MAKTKTRQVDMSINPDDIKLPEEAQTTEAGEAKETPEASKAKPAHMRSDKYKAARSVVDRTKFYAMDKAVELLKKTSYSAFTGTLTADVIVKEAGISADVTFPHSTGRTFKVAVASDETLAKIEAGQIDFDLLVAAPQMMPKLAKFARVLGPKGLMPNPKNGTVAPNPEKRAEELAGGKTTVRTERKAPLMHVVLGKMDQAENELIENAESLIRAIGSRRILKFTLSATMSPGVKIDLSSYQAA